MSRNSRTIIGVLLSLILLGWALRDVDFSEVIHRIRTADVPLFTLSILVTLAGFYIRAVRWGILLTPIDGNVPFNPRISATFVGFAANNVLPARVGEFARAYSLSRQTRIPAASALATLVIERLLDGLVLVGLLFAAMATASFPTSVDVGGIDLRAAAMTFAVIMLVVAGGLFLAVANPKLAGTLVRLVVRVLPARFHSAILDAMRAFASGLVVLRNGRLFVVSVALAIGQWVFLATSYLLGFRAFGIDHVPFAGAVFLQSLISLAVAVPSSPGFFGPFEAAARLGLGLWDTPANQAISFAIGYHIAGFIPVTLIGVYYVWRLGLRWSDVRESEETVEHEVQESTAHPDLESRG